MNDPANLGNSSIAVEWLIPAAKSHVGLLIYVHGGSFLFGPSPRVIALMTTIASQANMGLIMPRPRLAPEHKCPAGVDDIGYFFDQIEQSGFTADRIALAGEQTGPNLILAALQQNHRCLRFKPAAQVFFSPWLDMSLSSWNSLMNRLGIAHVHSREFTEMVVLFYLGFEKQKISASHPLASPIFGSMENLAPTMVHASESDISLDDARALIGKLTENDCAASLHLWPRIRHMWERYELNYCRDSIDLSVDFLKANLSK